MFADIRAGGDGKLLVFAVDQFAHALYKQAFGIARENRVPLAAPQNFDHVPASAAECRFELLNDLAVAAHRAVKPLEVAVDHKNQVVQFFAGSKRDRAERFRLIRLTVTQERPDFGV